MPDAGRPRLGGAAGAHRCDAAGALSAAELDAGPCPRAAGMLLSALDLFLVAMVHWRPRSAPRPGTRAGTAVPVWST